MELNQTLHYLETNEMEAAVECSKVRDIVDAGMVELLSWRMMVHLATYTKKTLSQELSRVKKEKLER